MRHLEASVRITDEKNKPAQLAPVSSRGGRGQPPVCIVFDGDEADAEFLEIAENLHRNDLTKLERAEQIARWVELTEEKLKAQLAPLDKAHDRGRENKGINAAVRELGIDRTEAQRAAKRSAI